MVLVSGCHRPETSQVGPGDHTDGMVFTINSPLPLPPGDPSGSMKLESIVFEVPAVIANRSDSSKWFTGYFVNFPICFLETRDREDSAWQKDQEGIECATGLDIRELPSGHVASFRLPIRGKHFGKFARFGIAIGTKSTSNSPTVVHYSNVIRVGR